MMKLCKLRLELGVLILVALCKCLGCGSGGFALWCPFRSLCGVELVVVGFCGGFSHVYALMASNEGKASITTSVSAANMETHFRGSAVYEAAFPTQYCAEDYIIFYSWYSAIPLKNPTGNNRPSYPAPGRQYSNIVNDEHIIPINGLNLAMMRAFMSLAGQASVGCQLTTDQPIILYCSKFRSMSRTSC